MICISLAGGPRYDGLWCLAFQGFKFLTLPLDCMHEVLRNEKKCFLTVAAFISMAGSIVWFGGPVLFINNNFRETHLCFSGRRQSGGV